MLRSGLSSFKALYTRTEACAALGVSLPTFHRLVKAGRLHVTHIGARTFVARADLERLIETSREEP